MLNQFKTLIKKIIGPHIFGQISPFWHGGRGFLASFYFGNPSKKMNLIGITGTKGKTSTTVLTARILNKVGIKTGFLTTALMFDGEREIQNPTHMSTIDPWKLQKFLAKCQQNGCQNMVLELSSQGLEQNRHWGLSALQIGVFLNIYPEHLQAHGSWENYKKAKAKLFKLVKKNGVAIVNGDLKMRENSNFMVSFGQNLKKIFIQKDLESENQNSLEILGKRESFQFYNILENGEFYKTLLWQVSGREIEQKNEDLNGTKPNLAEQKNEKILKLSTKMTADYELTNLVFALTICQNLNPSFQPTSEFIAKISTKIPGRMEWLVVKNELFTN